MEKSQFVTTNELREKEKENKNISTFVPNNKKGTQTIGNKSPYWDFDCYNLDYSFVRK